jgi:adenylyltransferase/sulfurtransferase
MPETEPAAAERYSRQTILPEFGIEGQRRLAAADVIVIGCGALGGHLSTAMVQAGVGRVTVVDRDVVELNNLQRQVLFTEADAAEGLPKAEAAAARLRQINSAITIEGVVADVTPRTIESLIQGKSLVLDGTDNFETRFLINDACIKHGIPWVYGGAIGAMGMTMPILPGRGPCLRCILPEPPPPGSQPTCDTYGILNTAPAIVAALQASTAFKLLLGKDSRAPALISFDVWEERWERLEIPRDPDCPACVRRELSFLSAERLSRSTTLCGRQAVQITPPIPLKLDLEALARRLGPRFRPRYNGFILQLFADDLELLVFPDGRTLVKGTTDESTARKVHARYIGT